MELSPEAKERLREKIETTKAALDNPAGEKFMELLVDKFQRSSMFSPDAMKMARNTAQYDLVEEIKTLLEA